MAASGTLEVADATGMPATGNFRIRVGNVAGSILRVTARAGTTLTVDVEQDDGNAAIGDTVRLVNTAAAMEALKADAIAGSGGGGGFPWWPTIVDPTLPAWAWQNQGGAAVVQANGIVFLSVPSSTTSIRSRLISAVATPWTITTLLRPRHVSATQQYGGLVLRESSTGKLYIFYVLGNGTVQAVKFTNDTTFSTVGAVNVAGPLGYLGDWQWLRVTDNGTNLLFSISLDGRNFIQLGSEGRTVFMAGGPNQYGIFGNADGGVAAFDVSFTHWVQT